jgi:hypothetical protein
MFICEVKKVTQSKSSDIQRILQEQDFVPLPTGIDGAQLAVRTYEAHDVACCDFLVYRELIEKGETLSDEVLLLLQALTKLKTQLQSSSLHNSSKIQSQTISFLGKKTHILTNKSGRLLRCRLYPLFISHSTSNYEISQKFNTVFVPPILPITQLETYLTQYLVRRNPKKLSIETTFRPLQRSYHYLELALLFFPFLLGLSGILWELGLIQLALITILAGILGPGFLLRKASNSFRQFRLRHSIQVTIPKSPSTVITSPEDVVSIAQPADSSQHNLSPELVITGTERGES